MGRPSGHPKSQWQGEGHGTATTRWTSTHHRDGGAWTSNQTSSPRNKGMASSRSWAACSAAETARRTSQGRRTTDRRRTQRRRQSRRRPRPPRRQAYRRPGATAITGTRLCARAPSRRRLSRPTTALRNSSRRACARATSAASRACAASACPRPSRLTTVNAARGGIRRRA